MRTATRRGLGLIIVMVIVAVLTSALLLISHQTQLGGAIRSAVRDRQRETALGVLRSALAEARLRLVEEAGRQGTPAYRTFRSGNEAALEVATPQAAGLGDGVTSPPETRAKVLWRQALDLTAYEQGGLLRITSRVRYGTLGMRTIECTADYEFKTVNLSVPRPFGKMALTVASGHTLLGRDPNARLAYSASALRNLAALASQAERDLSGKPGVPSTLAAEVSALVAQVTRMAPAPGADFPVPGPQYFGAGSDFGHNVQVMLPAGAATGTVPLASLHLPTRLDPRVVTMKAAEVSFDAASRELHQALRIGVVKALFDREALEAPGHRFVAAAQALATAHRGILDEVAAYQRMVHCVAGTDRDHWVSTYWPRLARPAWERRAFYSADAMGALVGAGPVDGVFILQGASDLIAQPVIGRRIVVAQGPCRIQDLVRDSAQAGAGMRLATFIVHGSVELSGTVDASVLVMAPPSGSATVTLSPTTRLTGSLALGPGVELDTVQGQLTSDPLTDSGGFGTPLLEDRYRVALSPAPLSQGVVES